MTTTNPHEADNNTPNGNWQPPSGTIEGLEFFSTNSSADTIGARAVQSEGEIDFLASSSDDPTPKKSAPPAMKPPARRPGSSSNVQDPDQIPKSPETTSNFAASIYKDLAELLVYEDPEEERALVEIFSPKTETVPTGDYAEEAYDDLRLLVKLSESHQLWNNQANGPLSLSLLKEILGLTSDDSTPKTLTEALKSLSEIETKDGQTVNAELAVCLALATFIEVRRDITSPRHGSALDNRPR